MQVHMMLTNTSDGVLRMEPLDLSPTFVPVAVLFGTLLYLSVLFCNIVVLATIALNRKLHKPMFVLLFNLPISDLIGATAFFPQLILSIATKSRFISPSACFLQGFLIHLYGTGNLLILTAMAYDRYVAICRSLRYNSIMNVSTLSIMITIVWVLTITLPLILFGMAARFKFCRTNIVDMYCNNPSLLKLVCDDISANNYYGLLYTVLVQGSSVLVVAYTYIQILHCCIVSRNGDARRKAIKTCGTHLVIFLILQINTLATLLAHRVRNASPHMRRSLGISILVFPPILDPIIYGLNTKELRKHIAVFLKRYVSKANKDDIALS